MEATPTVGLMLANFHLGGAEVILILTVCLILFGAKRLPDLARALSGHSEDLSRLLADMGKDLVLAMAQGFGVGRIPAAPGTFGSLVGLLWFVMLVATENFWLYLAGTILGLALSVWCCGVAEQILRQTDPPSVVLDEITALPVCFVPWVASAWIRSGALPAPESFFTGRTWIPTAIIFVLFRLFDIVKPWPVRQSQHLAGGLGVTVDDFLAAIYVALITLFFVL